MGYEPLADVSCAATAMRRRDEWIRLGVWDRLRLACRDAYARMIGLHLANLAVDSCITKVPCGGECAGRSPVDRGKDGMKRLQLTEGGGVPLATVSAPANIRDDTVLSATLAALKDFAPLSADVRVHLDAGYDYRPCREALDERACTARPPTAVNPRRSRSALGRGADQLVVQRLRQIHRLHRKAPRLRRRLPRPGPPPSSRSVPSFRPPGTPTDGPRDQAHHADADLLADALHHSADALTGRPRVAVGASPIYEDASVPVALRSHLLDRRG